MLLSSKPFCLLVALQRDYGARVFRTQIPTVGQRVVSMLMRCLLLKLRSRQSTVKVRSRGDRFCANSHGQRLRQGPRQHSLWQRKEQGETSVLEAGTRMARWSHPGEVQGPGHHGHPTPTPNPTPCVSSLLLLK